MRQFWPSSLLLKWMTWRPAGEGLLLIGRGLRPRRRPQNDTDVSSRHSFSRPILLLLYFQLHYFQVADMHVDHMILVHMSGL